MHARYYRTGKILVTSIDMHVIKCQGKQYKHMLGDL